MKKDYLRTVSGRTCFVSPHFSRTYNRHHPWLFLLCEVDSPPISSPLLPMLSRTATFFLYILDSKDAEKKRKQLEESIDKMRQRPKQDEDRSVERVVPELRTETTYTIYQQIPQRPRQGVTEADVMAHSLASPHFRCVCVCVFFLRREMTRFQHSLAV